MTRTPRHQAVDRAVNELKAKGLWDKLDALYVFSAPDAQAAAVNWKNPELPMSKKDFEALAHTIKQTDAFNQEMRNLITLALCKQLKKDYPKFKPDKFVEACGADTSVLLAV